MNCKGWSGGEDLLWRGSCASPELIITAEVAYLCVRSHLFDIGLLELHDDATAWPSFVVISVRVVEE
jgi:hypothetical protein